MPLLKAVKFNKGEYIFTKGLPNDEIYFVVRGEVGIILPEFEDLVYVRIQKEDYFGDIDYVIKNGDNKRFFNVKALEDTETFCLSKKELGILEDNFPDVVQ